MWGAHFQQSSQIQLKTLKTLLKWRFHENFGGKWFSKWELCNLTKIFNNILSTAVEKWEICIKKEEKGKKRLKRVKKIRQIVAGRGLICSSAIPKRDEMDTGGEKSDNDIMMESTTSDSGKKVHFFLLFYKRKAKFLSFFEFQACCTAS